MQKETFQRMAIEQGKTLVNWDELDEKEKKEVIDNFEKYLITFGC